MLEVPLVRKISVESRERHKKKEVNYDYRNEFRNDFRKKQKPKK